LSRKNASRIWAHIIKDNSFKVVNSTQIKRKAYLLTENYDNEDLAQFGIITFIRKKMAKTRTYKK
jgi:hypothetical protein